MIIRESVKIGDKTVTFETGRIAKQAGGSVFISCGESVLLVTACGNEEARPGTSFLPLTCDYIEKTYAAGKIPGGFFKREGRLRDHETLTSRIIDRPCRPLFPDDWRAEIQIVATVMSADRENPTDILALTGASLALMLSPVPWDGPVAGVRVGKVDGKLIANPTFKDLEKSTCDIVIAATKNAIVMVEGEAQELTEAEMVEALAFGKDAVQGVLELQERIREAVGKPKFVHTPATPDATIAARVKDVGLEKIKAACNVREKFARYAAFKAGKKHTVKTLASEFEGREEEIKEAYNTLQYNTMREEVVFEKVRVDGRDTRTVRPIAIEATLLPRVHGSALFTRGETQSIVTATLGTRRDEQRIDGLTEDSWKNFLLHYNFPPYSVGETKMMRGPGRREIGHGNLAERALKGVIPSKEEFPYTIRIVSEITESNGSSSMATVCGGSLAMMDAGIPVRTPVAGVAMGLIMIGDKYTVLTDILGDEDHLGDMDFKVCGTNKGITAIQMDIKIGGLTTQIMSEAMDQAREARLHILAEMAKVLPASRPELSRYAPRITSLKVKPDQIRTIIGPGGKMIKAIVEQTGVAIDVEDDGTVNISSDDSEAVKKAIAIIESLTTEPEVGATYTGIVKRIERYGAFIEIAPGKDGLCHITDMAWEYVDNVESLMQLGDEVEVKITAIDREGRIRLSRKDLLEKPEGYVERPPREDRDDRGGDRDRGPRRDGGDRDRGPRRDGGGGGRDRDRGPRRERTPREGGERPPREGGEGEGRRRRRREGGEGGGGEGGGSAPSGGSEG